MDDKKIEVKAEEHPAQSPATLLHVRDPEKHPSDLVAKDPAGAPSIFQVEVSDWECQMFGCGNSILWRPNKDQLPNRFWRWMQYICFGNKWRRWR